MSSSVLGSLSLGYQFLWGQSRQIAAVRLFVEADDGTPVDARHLLAALDELWPERLPPLLLSVRSRALLLDLLQHATPRAPWLELPQAWLNEPDIDQQIAPSPPHGAVLVWHGDAGEHPAAELAPRFRQHLFRLTPAAATASVQVTHQQDHGTAPVPSPLSPMQPGQIYESVPNLALVRHGLDRQDAWAVAGWPLSSVLHARGGQPVPPDRRSVEHLLGAVQADASLEVIERILSDEPILTYRFLQHANSREVGSRHEVESVRQGLMMLGLSPLQAWLEQQLPQASDEADLNPVRTALVMRAHLMDKLLEAGEQEQLRSEVYLCGLLTDIAPLLAEPLDVVLERLPLSWRIRDALLHGTGPYAPYLAVAAALASADTRTTHHLCESHALDMEEVNRALLRTLVTVTTPPSRRF